MKTESGNHWLLLRGLARESAHWGKFIAQMQAVFPEDKIHTLDLPGTGRFYQHISPSNIPDITGHVRRQAIEQGFLQQPLHLLALSLGGMVAWEWLQKHPEELSSLALVNTSFANLSPFYQRLRWQSYAKFVQILLHNEVYQREQAIIRLVSNRYENDHSLVDEWSNIQHQRPVSLGNGLRQIVAAATYKATADILQRPVILLNSRADRLVAPACSVAICTKWRIELHTHPWAGHDLSLDDGVWLANCLKTWADNMSTSII